MHKEVYRNDRERGETILIRSFSDSTREYEVTDTSCSCPHSRIQGAMCRHRLLFGMIQRIRRSKLSTSRDEEVAREIVASVLDRTNRLDESYEAMLEARAFRFATKELCEVAHVRHRENIAKEVAKLEKGAA